MALYAAYGSNMDPRQMAERAPHSPSAGTGWLDGWRLTFGGEDLGWEGALATVVEEPGSQVFVVLYDLTELDELTLDTWEGAARGLRQDPGADPHPRRRQTGLALRARTPTRAASPRRATWASWPTPQSAPGPPTTTSATCGPGPAGTSDRDHHQ